MTKNNEEALNAFLAKKVEIDEALERMQQYSNEYFHCYPDEINWGDVGTLEHFARLLKDITDFAFQEGENAA